MNFKEFLQNVAFIVFIVVVAFLWLTSHSGFPGLFAALLAIGTYMCASWAINTSLQEARNEKRKREQEDTIKKAEKKQRMATDPIGTDERKALVSRATDAYRTTELSFYIYMLEDLVYAFPPPPQHAAYVERYIASTIRPIHDHFKKIIEAIPDITTPLHTTLGYIAKPDPAIFARYDITKMQGRWISPPLKITVKNPYPRQSVEDIYYGPDQDFVNMCLRVASILDSDEAARKEEKEMTIGGMLSQDENARHRENVERSYIYTLSLLASRHVPLAWELTKRFEHTQIVGSSGSGKTTLLSYLILFDLHQPDPPSLIFVDPKRTLIDKLSRLAIFDGRLRDRLIIIRPEYRPALNIFDTSQGKAGIVDAVTYLCSMLATELTDKMKGFYRNVANLLLVFPQTMSRNATLLDLYDLMVPQFPQKYAPAVQGLREIQRRFFEQGDFESREYRDTKQQIRMRLNALTASEHLDSLFTSQYTAVNVGAEMQKGSIILVDCGEGTLESNNDVTAFGCIFIAEVMRAVMQRNSIPPEKRRPAFMYVDEAATFFKGDMSYFFTAARQCKVGGIFAFHTLAQANTDTLRSMLMTNTSTKIISKYAADDAPAFNRHISMTPEELKALPNWHWACSIRQVQDKAVAITCSPDELDQAPLMSEAAYENLIRRNRQRVSGDTQRQRRQSSASPSAPPGAGQKQRSSPRPTWTEQDELALADAYAQLAVALRRKDAERSAELQTIVKEAEERRAAAQDTTPGEEEYHL